MGIDVEVIMGYGFIVPDEFASAFKFPPSEWTYNGEQLDEECEIGIFKISFDCYEAADVFIYVLASLIKVPTRTRLPCGDSALIDIKVTEEQTKETQKFADFVREMTGCDDIKIGNYVFAFRS
eukprot:gene2971-3237_t